MEKKNGSTLKKAKAAVIALIVFGYMLTSMGLIGSIVENQNQIVEQQNTLIDLQIDLIDLQEKILENINSVYVDTAATDQGLPLNYEVHLEMRHWRDGELIAYSRRAGVLTDTGKEWIEDQLGDAAVAEGDYIGCSNNSGAPSSAWSILPDEITTGGMGRAQGTYADDGTGQWNITKSFSPTESNSTQLIGLYYSAYPASSLIASDTITIINYQNGDTVQLRFTVTAT
jgi:hypothetical protein